MSSYAIVIVGPPGSGKTTTSRAVAEALEIPLISSGDIARALAEVDSNTHKSLARGEWAEELAMRAEVQARIEAAVVTSPDFVIEGFPRRIEQLYILESMSGIMPLYFVLDVGSLRCMRRIISRHRKDDHPDIVATRFRIFKEFTQPMIEFLIDDAHWVDGELPSYEQTDLVTNIYWKEKQREIAMD